MIHHLSSLKNMYHRTWVSIDLQALSHNISSIQQILPKGTLYCSMIKADAYGHGIQEIAEVALQSGVSYLGVATLDEAILLRKQGITVPVFVSGAICPSMSDLIVSYGIRPTIFSLEQAKSLSLAAQEQKKDVGIHIKIDTGMNRIGILPSHVLPFFKEIFQLPRIYVEGVFTHFASADAKDLASSFKQLGLFQEVIASLKKNAYAIPLYHSANSAATLRIPESHFDMVRVGIAQYGLWPSEDVPKNISLKPVMQFYSTVTHCKTIRKDEKIGYSGTFVAKKGSRIATIAVGYADGLPRILSNRGRVLLHDTPCPIVGNICMDQCMIDVSHVPNVQIGDSVSLFGSPKIPVEQLAALSQTINYEIICGISKRVPRIYL